MAKNTAGKRAGSGKPRALKIKKGDRVVVIAGRDRGREGTVIHVDPASQRVYFTGTTGGVEVFKQVDPDHYESSLRDAQVEATIVSRGHFRARLTWAELHHLQIS